MATRTEGETFVFECQRCGTVQNSQANTVPRLWAVLTTFNEESAKYYYCGPCKEAITTKVWVMGTPG